MLSVVFTKDMVSGTCDKRQSGAVRPREWKQK